MTTALTRRHSESIALVALFAALLGVMGLIPKIDLPLGVHISIQTLGVMLAGCLLGPWRGLQAMLVFLVAVAAGLPLLSGGAPRAAPSSPRPWAALPCCMPLASPVWCGLPSCR